MNTTRTLATMVIACTALLGGCDRKNGTPTTSTGRPPTGPATAENKTPMDQSQSGEDVKITAAIRRAIMDDKDMSTNAQNCKIITEKTGVVTLRGVVNSQAEKDSIGAKAKAVAGVTRVDNLLEVKPG